MAWCLDIVRNACQRSIVPLPLVLGDRAGLASLEFLEQRAGESDHRVRPGPWRRRPYESQSRYAQPVLVDRLDDIVHRYELPAPNHLRVQVQRTEDAVLRGAAETLRQSALRSMLLVLSSTERRAALERLLSEAGLRLQRAPAVEGVRTILVFLREPAPAGSRLRSQGWAGVVRRYFTAGVPAEPQ